MNSNKTHKVVVCIAMKIPDDYRDANGNLNEKYQGTVYSHTDPVTFAGVFKLNGKTYEPFLDKGFNEPDSSHSKIVGSDDDELDNFGDHEILGIAELPMHRIVCTDCEGEGYVLNESMRYHAYSREEFEEAFEDERDQLDYDCHNDNEGPCEDSCKCPAPQLEYFKRGGIYDVVCPTCKGKNVIDVVDIETLEFQTKMFFWF